MINTSYDDIRSVRRGIIAHCVNCQGKMGSGVAKALYTKWPKVKSEYLKNYEYASKLKGRILGTVQYVNVADGVTVANCHAQECYGYDGKRYGDLDVLKETLSAVAYQCRMYDVLLHVPYKLASDRAGLSWDDEVYPLLQEIEKEFKINIVIWKYNGE